MLKTVSTIYCKKSYSQPDKGGTKKTFLGERKKQPRVVNYKAVVLLDSGCNVPVMSPFVEDFTELRGGAGQSIIGTSVVPVDGVGRFLGTIEGVYSPQSTTQSAIIAETMLEVLEYRIERRTDKDMYQKVVSHPSQPELTITASMSSNGLYYFDKEELRGFLKLDRVLGAGKDQDQINSDVLEVQEPWITVEPRKKKRRMVKSW